MVDDYSTIDIINPIRTKDHTFEFTNSNISIRFFERAKEYTPIEIEKNNNCEYVKSFVVTKRCRLLEISRWASDFCFRGFRGILFGIDSQRINYKLALITVHLLFMRIHIRIKGKTG